MTIAYNLRDTALSIPSLNAAHEFEMNLGTGAAGESTEAITLATEQAWGWATPADEPNFSSWPAASGGAPYRIRLDVTAIGSNITGLAAVTLYRLRSDMAAVSSLSSGGSWDSTTGTGLHTWSDTTWTASGSLASDRFGVQIGVSTSNTMMDNSITIGNLNTTTVFAEGPWSTAEPEVAGYPYVGGGYYG